MSSSFTHEGKRHIIVCNFPDCNETEELRGCDQCNHLFCHEHSSHFENSSAGETTQCDLCIDQARKDNGF